MSRHMPVANDPKATWEPQRRRPAEERGQKISTMAGRGALRDLLPDV
jgi:hypothetical protein